MSEKRVNIRITASTSDFDKAIKNAQKQIEKLADTIEDLGDGKFGDKLEKQLESVADAAEKMKKNLEEMQESLDDMNKSKVDKLEKKLDDVSDSAEDLNDELEDTADTLEDLNKTKVDKLEKQFEETKKTSDIVDISNESSKEGIRIVLELKKNADVENIKNISVVEDSSVDRGGCIVETDFGAIDARISSQLTELEQRILEISPIKAVTKTSTIKQDF